MGRNKDTLYQNQSNNGLEGKDPNSEQLSADNSLLSDIPNNLEEDSELQLNLNDSCSQKTNEQLLQELQQWKMKCRQFIKQRSKQLNDPLQEKSSYDMIINLDSVQSFVPKAQQQENEDLYGLRIQKNHDRLDSLSQKVNVISLSGPVKSGKTCLLNLLTDKNFPSEYYTRTPGICVTSIHQDIFLNMKGSNNSISFDFDKNRHYQTYLRNMEDDVDDRESLENLANDMERANEDLRVTDRIQQDFLLKNSNIHVLVIPYLTCREQRLIKEISKKFLSEENKQTQKKLFIVHNLKELQDANHVKDYIQEVLMRAFCLSEKKDNLYSKDHQDQNNTIYIDNFNDRINHIVVAQQNSSAGEFYNHYAIHFLKHAIENYQKRNPFNIKKRLIEFLNNHLLDYVDLKGNTDELTQSKLFNLKEEKNQIFLNQGISISHIKELDQTIPHELKKVNETEKILLIEMPGVDKAMSIEDYNIHKGIFTVTFNQSEEIVDCGEVERSTRKKEKRNFEIKICNQGEIWNFIRKEKQDLKNGFFKYVFKKYIEEEQENKQEKHQNKKQRQPHNEEEHNNVQ